MYFSMKIMIYKFIAGLGIELNENKLHHLRRQ